MRLERICNNLCKCCQELKGEKERFVDDLKFMKEMVFDQPLSDFRRGHIEAINNVLELLGVDE